MCSHTFNIFSHLLIIRCPFCTTWGSGRSIFPGDVLVSSHPCHFPQILQIHCFRVLSLLGVFYLGTPWITNLLLASTQRFLLRLSVCASIWRITDVPYSLVFLCRFLFFPHYVFYCVPTIMSSVVFFFLGDIMEEERYYSVVTIETSSPEVSSFTCIPFFM